MRTVLRFLSPLLCGYSLSSVACSDPDPRDLPGHPAPSGTTGTEPRNTKDRIESTTEIAPDVDPADLINQAGSGGSSFVDTSYGSMGGLGGGPVALPPFDCSDSRFFPLRTDEDGRLLDDENEDPQDKAILEEGDGDLTVLLIFDKSGSMAESWGGKSRWQAGSDALLLGLDGILDTITMGGIFFPFEEEGAVPGCGVPPIELDPQIDFTSGRGFKEQWIAAACLAQPNGSTPLEHALMVADLAIESARNRDLVKARMRVVLVTDGEPTCEDDQESILEFPTKWSVSGIETHVIGLPGSQRAHDLLDEIAQAGGTGTHFSPAQLGEFEDQVYGLLR